MLCPSTGWSLVGWKFLRQTNTPSKQIHINNQISWRISVFLAPLPNYPAAERQFIPPHDTWSLYRCIHPPRILGSPSGEVGGCVVHTMLVSSRNQPLAPKTHIALPWTTGRSVHCLLCTRMHMCAECRNMCQRPQQCSAVTLQPRDVHICMRNMCPL